METKVLAETEWDRLLRAIPDPNGSPNLNGYIGSPDGVANPVTILFVLDDTMTGNKGCFLSAWQCFAVVALTLALFALCCVVVRNASRSHRNVVPRVQGPEYINDGL